MSNESDFQKILIKDVSFLWPRLDQPYRYNSQEKRTESCAPTVNNAGYSIAWTCTLTEGKELFEHLKAHYKASKARNPKLPEFKQVFGMKKDEAAGTVQFTAKKRAMSNDGKLNKPPVVIDGQRLPLDNKAIWSGSKGNLRVLAFATQDPDGIGGISLLLDVVQVTHASYGGDGLEDDFEVVTPKNDVGLDDFDGGSVNASAQPRQQKSANVPDDVAF